MAIIRSILLTVLLMAFSSAIAQPVKFDIRKSVLRITANSEEPDYKVPWNPGTISAAIGTGFIIDGHRIITNAHVVSNARFIEVEREGDPQRYIATVQFIAHDSDLAVLQVVDPQFFQGTVPLQFGPIPGIQSTLNVFGYPIGGDRLSVTKGIVSRVDFLQYTHSGVDLHLAVQIDAAINPGNSGGPVMQDQKVVGIAFQGYSGDVAQNVGYMIPTPVIRHFLTDISDGHYDRYVDLSINFFKLLNGAERRALGLPDDHSGVLVSSVSSGGSCDGKLQPGDVLLAIDHHSITSDGFVQLDGERMDMTETVERKFKDDKATLTILRNKQTLDVEVTLEPNTPYLMQASRYDIVPRFVLFGGLLFQPLSKNFMLAYQADDLRLRYDFTYFLTDEIYKEHPELIVLANILPDPVNAYLNDLRYNIVDNINGKKIKTLRDAADAFAQPSEYDVIQFIGGSRPAVLERSAVEGARQRILTHYNVRKEQNLEDTPTTR
jgi:S1-C subfamily serine protease